MPTIPLRIPQIGEGLQEARLVAVLKTPGERVRRDEPIYQMETDKAVMDVESPYDGVLVEWLGKIDELLPIGGEVALMEVAAGVEDSLAESPVVSAGIAEPVAAASEQKTRNHSIPPRTRAYAKEKGVSDEDLAKLAEGSGKLMPADIDAYLAGSGPKEGIWAERSLSPKQRLLASRLARGTQSVVQGTMSVAVNWEPIERERQRQKSGGDPFQPSVFTMFAFAVAQVLKEFPDFRSTLVGDDKVRTYSESSLGIAVGLPNDELVLAVVDGANVLPWRSFAEEARKKIEMARSGQDQAHEGVSLTLTNMQAFGLRDAIPVVVSPGVATLFMGEVYLGQDQSSEEPKLHRLVNLALSFDHRLINGVGAAKFLNAVKQAVETIGALV
jgi:pyruvate/2-oxoglutarate dehydrogenase complex dihydrolipoamide acyltransferase (E2) component